jgi:hypothetical protein
VTTGGYAERFQKSCIIHANSVLGYHRAVFDVEPHRAAANLYRPVFTADQGRLQHHHGLPSVIVQFLETVPDLLRAHHGRMEGLPEPSEQLLQPLGSRFFHHPPPEQPLVQAPSSHPTSLSARTTFASVAA